MNYWVILWSMMLLFGEYNFGMSYLMIGYWLILFIDYLIMGSVIVSFWFENGVDVLMVFLGYVVVFNFCVGGSCIIGNGFLLERFVLFFVGGDFVWWDF